MSQADNAKRSRKGPRRSHRAVPIGGLTPRKRSLFLTPPCRCGYPLLKDDKACPRCGA